MTDNEKRRQMADLLFEHHEAEQELAQLKEKATRLADSLKEIADWINQATSDTADSSLPAAVRPEIRIALGETKWREAMNFDAACKLRDEIEAARRKVRSLKQRKDSLGLK